MGILSKLFSGGNYPIEKELVHTYSDFYAQWSGESISDAKKTILAAIKTIKDEAHKEGTDKLPENFGTFLINEFEELHGSGSKIVENARLDGATDKDIEEWWNFHDLHRRMIVWHENAFRYANFLSFKQDGLNPEEAMAKVRKMFPMYGDPNDTTHTSGDDRPLRHELRGRVDKYRERHGAQKIQKALKNYKTYNAFIRSEMRAGRL